MVSPPIITMSLNILSLDSDLNNVVNNNLSDWFIIKHSTKCLLKQATTIKYLLRISFLGYL